MSTYVCNICGTLNKNGGISVHRELVPCESCGSNSRFRALMLSLVYGLTGRFLGLKELKPNPKIRGFGCSDSEVYASKLSGIFEYTNTFLHTEPRVDIADPTSLEKFANSNFIICSDVIEHTLEPPSTILRNLYNTLAQDGVLVLSAPTFALTNSIERYPTLRSYQTVTIGARHVIVYEPMLGQIGLDAAPNFHGGPGQILEMRILSHAQIIKELREAGFSAVETLGDSFGEFGAVWPSMVERADVPFALDGRVILARKTNVQRPARV